MLLLFQVSWEREHPCHLWHLLSTGSLWCVHTTAIPGGTVLASQMGLRLPSC